MSETVNSNDASSQASVVTVAETATTEQVAVAAEIPVTETTAVSEADPEAQIPEAPPRSRMAVAQEIGNTLAAARQEQGVTLEDISSRLKVSVSKLQAIEAGEIDSLPDFTFAKGVMRSYAKTLRMPIDGLLDQLRQHEPELTVGLKDEAGLGETYNPMPLLARVDKKLVLRVLSGVLLLGLAYAVFSTLQTMSANKTASPAAASQSVVTATASSAASGAETGMTQTALPAIVPLPSVTASAAAPSVTPASVVAPVPVAPAASSAVTSNVTGQGEVALRVRFVKDSWFEVRDQSGQAILAITAKSGSEKIVKGKPPLKVMIGNVSGVEDIEYEGVKVDLQAFTKSNVARLNLPRTEQ